MNYYFYVSICLFLQDYLYLILYILNTVLKISCESFEVPVGLYCFKQRNNIGSQDTLEKLQSVPSQVVQDGNIGSKVI